MERTIISNQQESISTMTDIIYTHIFHPDNLPVGIKYENLDNIYKYADNTIGHLMITDLLDYHVDDECNKIINKISDKLAPKGQLQVQSTDLLQLMLSVSNGTVDETMAKIILYPHKKSIHSIYDIEKLLLKHNFTIINKRYINVFEYFIVAQKNEQ